MSSEDSSPKPSGADSSDSLLAFADALAAQTPRDPGRNGAEVCQYVTFFLRDHEIGLPILQCREILRPSAITRVPEAPEHVRGIVNLRGRIVPAVDTRACLGFEPAPLTVRSRLLVVEVAARQFALVVDRISREARDLRDRHPHACGRRSLYCRGCSGGRYHDSCDRRRTHPSRGNCVTIVYRKG
jgi:purine-binding chemotaxis protein CheW